MKNWGKGSADPGEEDAAPGSMGFGDVEREKWDSAAFPFLCAGTGNGMGTRRKGCLRFLRKGSGEKRTPSEEAERYLNGRGFRQG